MRAPPSPLSWSCRLAQARWRDSGVEIRGRLGGLGCWAMWLPREARGHQSGPALDKWGNSGPRRKGLGRGGSKTGTQDLGLPPQGRDLWWTGGKTAQVHSSPLGSLLWGGGYPWSTGPHWWAGSRQIPPDPKALPISQSELYVSEQDSDPANPRGGRAELWYPWPSLGAMPGVAVSLGTGLNPQKQLAINLRLPS